MGSVSSVAVAVGAELVGGDTLRAVASVAMVGPGAVA